MSNQQTRIIKNTRDEIPSLRDGWAYPSIQCVINRRKTSNNVCCKNFHGKITANSSSSQTKFECGVQEDFKHTYECKNYNKENPEVEIGIIYNRKLQNIVLKKFKQNLQKKRNNCSAWRHCTHQELFGDVVRHCIT